MTDEQHANNAVSSPHPRHEEKILKNQWCFQELFVTLPQGKKRQRPNCLKPPRLDSMAVSFVLPPESMGQSTEKKPKHSCQIMGLERIYDMMPAFMQNLMCSMKGYLIKRRRYGSQFYDELRKLENGAYDQREELCAFLNQAKELPAYKGTIGDVTKENVYDVIHGMPIIDKNFVKSHIEDLTNHACTEPQFQMRTSGTTGGGLVFPYTVRMENKHWGVWWRYRRALGIDMDTWCGWFGGKRIINPNSHKPPFWRTNKPGRQVMFSSMHMTPETVALYHAEIAKRKLTWLHGYPSHIAKFAAFAIDKGLPPLTDVKFVTTGAENLLGNQMSLMQKMFPHAMIRQHYGLMEGVANISQDRNGEWIVDDDFAYVEFIPVESEHTETEGAKKTETCRIIGTGFSNPAFPLIRYDTGDLATIERREDGTVRVISIDGRSSNVLKGPDGFEINEARLSIVLHDFNHIVEAQFVQHTLTDISLLVVKNSSYSDEDEKQLRINLASCFDKRMNIQIKYVDEVEKTKSGKLRLVVSEIPTA